MADLELLLEAERRGILPPEKTELLAEARRRGLVPTIEGESKSALESSGLIATGLEPFRRVGAGLLELAKLPFRGTTWTEPLQTATNIGKGLLRAGPAIIGGTIGAPLGPAGAVAGAMGGEALYKGAEQLFTGEPQKPLDVLLDIATAGVGEALPRAGLPAVAAPFKKGITKEGQALLDLGKEAGFRPSPSDVRSAPLFRRIEALTGKAFGGGAIERRAAGEVEAVKGLAKGQAERVAGPRAETPDVPGLAAQQTLEDYATKVEQGIERQRGAVLAGAGVEPGTAAARGGHISQGLKMVQQARKFEEDILWDAVEAADTGTAEFALNKVAEAAANYQKKGRLMEQFLEGEQTSARLRSEMGSTTKPGPFFRSEERPGTLTTPEGKELGIPVETIGQRLPGGPGSFVSTGAIEEPAAQLMTRLARSGGQRIPFEQARVIKEELGRLYAAPGGQKYGGVYGALKDDLADFAQKDTVRSEAYRKAVDFTRENVVPFKPDQPLGRLILKGEPAAIVEELLRPGDKSINMLRAVAKQTGADSDVWKAIRDEAMSRAVDDPKAYARLGDETKAILFSNAQRSSIEALYSIPNVRQGKIASYLKKDPSAVVPSLIRNADAAFDDIRGLKGVIGGTPAWEAIQTEALNQLIDKPARIKNVGTKSLAELFTPEQNALLTKIDTWMKTSLAGQRAAKGEFRPTGVNTVSVAQAGGLVFHPTLTQAAISFAPWVVAHMITNPTVARLLSEGFEVAPGTMEAARIASQVMPHYEAVIGSERKKQLLPTVPRGESNVSQVGTM